MFPEQNWGVRAAGSPPWVWLPSPRAPGDSPPAAAFAAGAGAGDAKGSGRVQRHSRVCHPHLGVLDPPHAGRTGHVGENGGAGMMGGG